MLDILYSVHSPTASHPDQPNNMFRVRQTANAEGIVKEDAPGFVKSEQISLDTSLLRMDERHLDFFRATVSEDEQDIKARILEVQKK